MSGYIGPKSADVPVGTIATKGTLSGNSLAIGSNVVANTSAISIGSATINSTAFTGLSVATNTFTIGTAAYHVANGNLGVGTASPSYLVHVKGSGLYNGVIFADNSSTTGGGLFSVGVNGTPVGYLTSTGSAFGNTNSDLAIYAENGKNLAFFANGNPTVKMFIAANGAVGINTSTPQSSLEISATAADSVLSLTSAGTRRFQIKSLTGTPALTFFDEGAGLERLRINSSGYLGFNTGSTISGRVQFNCAALAACFTPVVSGVIGGSVENKVHITSSEPGLLISSDVSPTTGTNTGIAAYSLGAAIGFYGVNDIRSQVYWTNSPLVFTYGANTSAAPSERIRIATNGSVGIGNTAPIAKLHVEGEVFTGRVDTSIEGGQIGFGRSSDNARLYAIDCYGSGNNPELRMFNDLAGMVFFSASNTGVNYIKFNPTAANIGDANCLDDYEEGTFTPIFSSTGNFTYTRQFGRYTKIGNLVSIQVDISLSSQNGGSGVIKVGGMPFSILYTDGIPTIMAFGDNNWTTSRSNLCGYRSGSTVWDVYYNSGSNLTSTNITDIGQSGRILLTGTYQTSS